MWGWDRSAGRQGNPLTRLKAFKPPASEQVSAHLGLDSKNAASPGPPSDPETRWENVSLLTKDFAEEEKEYSAKFLPKARDSDDNS